MQSSDSIILSTARAWLTHHECLLVTVAKTWGASPRPVGSMMLIRSDGKFIGSVSGGCIEEDLIEKYIAGELSSEKVSIATYGIKKFEAQKFGLPCGGELQLVIERLKPDTSLDSLNNIAGQGSPILRKLNVYTGEVSYGNTCWNEVSSFDGEFLYKVFGCQWRVLLIGANDLSNHVAQVAKLLDFEVTVCDPREHANLDWIGAEISFTSEMPDEVVLDFSPVERSIILALTHDPKMDDMALMQALSMNFFYIGAIGSIKTQSARRKRLLQLDLSTEQIAKLHGPVGLTIGSKTPAEIAISIFAEITMLQHQNETAASTENESNLRLAQ